jgi:hypothetical protein
MVDLSCGGVEVGGGGGREDQVGGKSGSYRQLRGRCLDSSVSRLFHSSEASRKSSNLLSIAKVYNQGKVTVDHISTSRNFAEDS